MHMSLDGFIEGPNKDMSWMKPDTDDLWDDLFEMLNNVDLFLLGHGMWDEYRDYWKRALVEPGFTANEIKYARLAEKTAHLVFSNSVIDAGWKNSSIVAGDVAKEVAAIKAAPGRDIQVVGGAMFAGTLVEAGLIDEYRLMINPAILARGKSFFSGHQNRHMLEFTGQKIFSTGAIALSYKQLSTEDTNLVKPQKRNPETNK